MNAPQMTSRLTAVDLINLQIRLEYQLDPQGLLQPYPGSSEQAACILYQHSDGEAIFMGADLPPEVRRHLSRLAQHQELFRQPAAVLALLQRAGRYTQTAPCRSYVFATPPQLPEAAGVSCNQERWEILLEGQPVSWAWSIRENQECAEVAVETDPNFRKHGYARRVTSAWARSIISQGKTAFFSHLESNYASRRLAQSLGVRYFASSLSFE